MKQQWMKQQLISQGGLFPGYTQTMWWSWQQTYLLFFFVYMCRGEAYSQGKGKGKGEGGVRVAKVYPWE